MICFIVGDYSITCFASHFLSRLIYLWEEVAFESIFRDIWLGFSLAEFYLHSYCSFVQNNVKKSVSVFIYSQVFFLSQNTMKLQVLLKYWNHFWAQLIYIFLCSSLLCSHILYWFFKLEFFYDIKPFLFANR